MPEYRQSVIRVSAALYLLAGLIALSAIHLPGIRETTRVVPATFLAALAIPAAGLTWFAPWRRFHPNWFLIVGTVASFHQGLFLWLTGGSQSPFWVFALFIVLGAGAYFHDRWPLVVLAGLSALLPFSPLIYEPTAGSLIVSQGVVRSVTVAMSFFIAHRLFLSMERNLERAIRLRETRDDFILAVSHQLKTPLTSLRLALDLIKEIRGTTDPKSELLLENALRSSARLQAQLQRLTELFRLSSEQTELNFQAVSLADVAHSVAETVRDAAHAKELATVINVPPLVVRGDPFYLELALINLVQNAVNFTPKGGTIVISADSDDASALIRVTDSGPGIPPRERADLLQGYYHLAATPAADRRGVGAGTGLGLALSKIIIERHGGRLWIADTSHPGTTICLTLPLVNRTDMHRRTD